MQQIARESCTKIGDKLYSDAFEAPAGADTHVAIDAE
jgi:hypothetical protein